MSQRKHPASMAVMFSSPNKRAKTSSQHADETSQQTPVRTSSLQSHREANGVNGKNGARSKESIFNDPIHGNITIDGLCLRIVDTKEFQRLRKLAQLGTCNYVFPGATHSRFEHSIGVSHFAGKVARNLQASQPHLNITEEDILCVKVAGLCHDLGHGPFSHVFDGVFIPRVVPDTTWRHEDGSVQMLKHLLQKNEINCMDYGLSEADLLFIEEIIAGTRESERRGRTFEKFYLYDIVNNSRSGLDVDKLDYFMRDMRYTNTSSSTANFQRFIELGRVFPAEPIGSSNSGSGRRAAMGELAEAQGPPQYMICYPEKMVKEALDAFAVRFRLHQTIYTHKSVKKVEFMVTDALVQADEVIRIPGQVTASHPDGQYRMSECVQDPEALSNLNDQILTVIELSPDPRLKTAQELLRKIQNRQFYHCLGKTSYTRQSKLFRASEEEIERMIIECSEQIAAERQRRLTARTLSQHSRTASLNEHNQHGMIMDSPMRTSGSGAATGGIREDPFADLASPDSWRHIQSQDSLAGDFLQSYDVSRDAYSNLLATEGGGNGSYPVLVKGDIIVDKMHIHYGKKDQNPVANMRFYAKGAGPEQLARQVSEDVYQTLLPRTFEELAVRVFCRDPSKERLAARAFSRFCNTCNVHMPFPSQSQAEGSGLLGEDEDEDEEDQDGAGDEGGDGAGLSVGVGEVRQFAHISAAGNNGW